MGLRDFIEKLVNENKPPQPVVGYIDTLVPFVVKGEGGHEYRDDENKLFIPYYAETQGCYVKTGDLPPKTYRGALYPTLEEGDRVILLPVGDKWLVEKVLEDFYE